MRTRQASTTRVMLRTRRNISYTHTHTYTHTHIQGLQARVINGGDEEDPSSEYLSSEVEDEEEHIIHTHTHTHTHTYIYTHIQGLQARVINGGDDEDSSSEYLSSDVEDEEELVRAVSDFNPVLPHELMLRQGQVRICMYVFV
jgi:hypothetical protein